MKEKKRNRRSVSGRRRFLSQAGTVAGVAAGATLPIRAQAVLLEGESGKKDAHAYGERSPFENSSRTGTNGRYPVGPPQGVGVDFGMKTPLQDSIGYITPAALHFSIQHGYEPPNIDPLRHTLTIHGMVDRPLVFTMEDLKRLPAVSKVYFVECNGNSAPFKGAQRLSKSATAQDTHGYTSCSLWTGVTLAALLREASLQSGAKWIVAEGAEQGKHTKSIPIDKALEDVLVAYGQNGEALRPYQGYPLRLVVPGWEGINNVKWLRRIKVADQPYMGMRESTKYPSLRMDGKARWFQFEMGPKSVITRPSGGQKLHSPGYYEITGLAWSGGGAVRRVDVSTDGGKSWKPARIDGPPHPKAHARFGFDWNWNGEEAILQSRCVDERGETQPSIEEVAKIWKVPLDYFSTSTNIAGHFNAIQPWKISRDGSVTNVLFES